MAGKGFKYDAELFLEDIGNIFKTNLNDQIDLINDEKNNRSPGLNDKFDIDKVSDKAWYLNHIPNVWSYSPFIVWGLASTSYDSVQEDGALQELTAFIEIALQDTGDKPTQEFIFRLLRYSRALQDVAMKNFDKIRSYGKIRVEGLSPTLVDISDKRLRISGITITASIGLR